MSGLSRRGLLGAVTVAGSAPPCRAITAAPGPDADLIRICAEHAMNTRAVNASPDELDDDNPAWLTYLRTQRAIDAAKPRTMDGMLAKAQIAVIVSTHRGKVVPENGSGATWAWHLLNDLLRLGEAA